MKRGLWWAFFLVCGSASAQEGVRFRYSAPPECPSEQQFRELVQSRLLGGPSANESAWTASEGAVSVEVRLDPAHQRATLLLEEPNAAPVERFIAGDSCEELASGLAMITALAFGTARESSAAIAAIPTPEPSAASSPPARPPPAAPIAATPTPTEGAGSDATSSGKHSTPLTIGVGAGAWLNTWSAPSVMWGGDLFVRVAPKARQTWSLRVAALYGVDSSYVGDRLAQFRFVGGRAEGCPLAQGYFRQRLVGEACLALEMGALHGRGQTASALLEGSSDMVFAATALLTGRIRGQLGERFFVEGQGDVGVPLVHHEFVFEEPRERIFQTPTVGFSARFGLGVHFP
jgi:hypothetical protein